MGGGTGGVHRGVAQARHCTLPIPPLPPLMSGKDQRCPSTALHVPYPTRRTHPSWNGGGDRGCSPWRRPRTALQVAYPPLEKPTICVMGVGGGRGCSLWRRTSTALHVAYPPPPPPPPPPPLKIKNETYLFLVIYQKRQTTHRHSGDCGKQQLGTVENISGGGGSND